MPSPASVTRSPSFRTPLMSTSTGFAASSSAIRPLFQRTFLSPRTKNSTLAEGFRVSSSTPTEAANRFPFPPTFSSIVLSACVPTPRSNVFPPMERGFPSTDLPAAGLPHPDFIRARSAWSSQAGCVCDSTGSFESAHTAITATSRAIRRLHLKTFIVSTNFCMCVMSITSNHACRYSGGNLI